MHDVGGLIAFYRRQRAIIDTVLPTLRMKRLAVDVSGGRSASDARRMSAFLDTRPDTRRRLGLAALLRHAGTYRGAATGSPALITTDRRALYLQQPATFARELLHVAPGHFCVRSWPIDLRFRYDERGRVRRFSADSRIANDVSSDRLWIRA